MPTQEIGRLAMRQEGSNWNAYYAMQDTMEGAVYIGTMPIAYAQGVHRERFMELMKGIVSDIIEEKFGHAPEWKGEQSAPEHERSGNA